MSDSMDLWSRGDEGDWISDLVEDSGKYCWERILEREI